MNEPPLIAILLSTYNGSEFLPSQLDSVLDQSYRNFVIVARDDGSRDSSRAILERYRDDHPGKIRIVQDSQVNLGASGSFSALLQYALEHKAELTSGILYLAFCDQDDRWLPDKIERQVNKLQELELELPGAAAGATIPLLVHSDLRVVNEQEGEIAPSFVRYQGLEIERNGFINLVISNLVTGCTAVFNEALAKKAAPVPDEAIMHDWWLALVASAFGRVCFIDEPLVLYRQHGGNTIGAKEFVPFAPSYWQRVLTTRPNQHLLEVARQAGAFIRRYRGELSRRDRFALALCRNMRTRVGFLQRFFYRLARRF